MKTKRTSSEISEIFTGRGCEVEILCLGHSYRTGGQIFIYAPNLNRDNGMSFTPSDIVGFDGTGYDGRGRSYSVWLVTPGEYVSASESEHANAAEEFRLCFGTDDNPRFFIRRDQKSRGLNDLGSAFAALGL
jgi:hypothetical protein